MTFVCQLPKIKQFVLYKTIKRQLLELDLFSYENLLRAMNSKVNDLPYEVQEVV